MPQVQKQGLVSKQKLTVGELAEIEQLAALCEEHEQLHMRISWDMLQSRPGVESNDFLFYEDGALVGYLCIDSWGIDEKELVGMVHPAYRRRGIFRRLFEAARDESKSWGVKRVLLICEHNAASGRAFVRAIGAVHDFSEHEMVLESFQERGTFDERLIFRPASADDLDLIVAIKAGSFDDEEEHVRQMVLRALQDANRQYYIATLGGQDIGCKEPVGCLRLDEEEEAIGIYAFGVLPEYRRRGYGRQMLEEVIRLVRARSQKTVMLDVDVENNGAIALYRSCGFHVKTTYEYYAVEL